MYKGSRRISALVGLLAVISIAVGACSSNSSSGPSSTSHAASTASTASTGSAGSTSSAGSVPSTSPQTSHSSAPVSSAAPGPVVAKSGVTVTGAFGVAPKVNVPATAAPKALTEQTLISGTGAKVSAGDTLIANYVGETWGAKPHVFDSSFSRGEPAGFVIGKGRVIPGWDKTLVGKRLGSRMLLTIPPADGYGAGGNSQAGITGTDTLVFVVDLVADYKPNASAPGVVASDVPATGWPKITNVPGKRPTITSVAGVKAPSSPESKLLVKGSGAKIDTSKTLVLQLVQTDVASGNQTHATWGSAPQLVPAANVLQVLDALKGQSVGARAVALLPATPAQAGTATSAAQPASPAEILVVDVVGQF